MTRRPPFDLTGRNALVTGSSAGIGWAVTRALAAAGARVALHGLEPEAELRRIAQDLPGGAGEAVPPCTVEAWPWDYLGVGR